MKTTIRSMEHGVRSRGLILILGLFCLTSFSLLLTPATAQTEYELLAPIPLSNLDSLDTKTNTAKFIPGLVRLAIGLATALAVLMLIYAGIKYMSTDAFTGKEEAKGIIENALWGLLLAMSAWIIIATINPRLLNFNLSIEPQEIDELTIEGGEGLEGRAGTVCTNCQVVTVPHKPAPNGCRAPGPCYVQSSLNTKLVELHRLQPLQVTESYPPTRAHRAPCHSDGSCVDAVIASANGENIKRFIQNATTAGLNAQFETETERRAQDIRSITGLSSQQVFYVPGIIGEHFSIYNR